MSVGICLALRLDGLDETAQVFTLMSDGDCQEGQSWEGAMSAAHFGLPNLTAIVDYNHLQTDGTTEEVMDTGDVRAKFESFGWDAVEIDGHDMDAVVESLGAQPHARPSRRDRLPDQEGPRGLLHGGPLRLPRQAAEPGAGRAGDGGARERPTRSRPRRSGAGADGERADRRGRGRRPSRSPPGRPTATRSLPSARATRRSSPSTPTSPSRPSR